MALLRNFGAALKTVVHSSTRAIATSSTRSSDHLFVHRDKDPDVELFEFNDGNIQVC